MARIITTDEDVHLASSYSPIARVIWYVLGIINTLLGLRFVLRLFGANPAAPFTDFIYSLTSPLLAPFRNVIRSSAVGTGIIEWSTLLAMAIYWLIAYALVRLFTMARPVARY